VSARSFVPALLFAAASCRQGEPPEGSRPSGSPVPRTTVDAPSPRSSGLPSAAPGASATAHGFELETVDDEPEPVEPVADASASCAPRDASLKPVELLRFTFTSEVVGKDARGRLESTRPGQRVYSHLVLRNRSGLERCVTIELLVNGVRRTTLTQKLGKSWSWRTWGYNTLRHDDRGKLEAIVRDDQGVELTRRELPIVAAK